jgi:two-component system, LytTR family, response regulator
MHPIRTLLFVRSGKRVLPLRACDIIWIEAAGNYVRIHTCADAFLVRGSLAAMLMMLDSTQFVQIHKSSIINLDAVTEMHSWFSGQMRVVLKNDVTLTLSRTYRQQLEERVQFLG